jgi:hypothetical protein
MASIAATCNGRIGRADTAMASIAATCNGGSGELFGTGKLVEPDGQAAKDLLAMREGCGDTLFLIPHLLR